jgi:arginine repressor
VSTARVPDNAPASRRPEHLPGAIAVGNEVDDLDMEIERDGALARMASMGAYKAASGTGRSSLASSSGLEVSHRRPMSSQRSIGDDDDELSTKMKVLANVGALVLFAGTIGGLVKLADPAGGSFYAKPGEVGQAGPRPQLARVLQSMLHAVDGVGPFVVLKTAPGTAGAVSAALDEAGWPEVIGTLAGDDTVLVITRSEKLRKSVAERVRGLGG